MPTALIKFTQASPGPGAGGNGQALFGVIGTPVTVANVDNTSVDKAQYEIDFVPPGSAVTTGVKQGYSTTLGWTGFTPDVPGGYVVRLRVKDVQGNESVDVRVFGVVETSGRFMPPMNAGNRALNFAGQLFGWFTYLREWLIALDALELRTGREDTTTTSDSSAHTLTSIALPTSGLVLVKIRVVAIKSNALVAKWWEVERAYHHNATSFAAGTKLDINSEAFGVAPAWTVDLDLSSGAARVQVNSAGDTVKWRVSHARLIRLAT